jgi:hypothetical protein
MQQRYRRGFSPDQGVGEAEWYPVGGDYGVAIAVDYATDKSGGYRMIDQGESSDNADETAPVTVGVTSYPNPFNPRVRVRYAVEAGGQVRVSIFDARGHRVRSLVSAVRTIGVHEVEWDGRDDLGANVAAGCYLARVSDRSGSRTTKLTLVR